MVKMLTPRTTFCKKCSLSKQQKPEEGICSENLYSDKSFLDWESYLDIHYPDYRGNRCDLIDDNNQDNIIFIEQKARDWFDLKHYFPTDKRDSLETTNPTLALKLVSKYLSDCETGLNKKIEHTVTLYSKINSKIIKGMYILAYSKIHTMSWKESSIPNSLIKQLVRNKMIKHSPLTIGPISILVDIKECTNVY